MKKLFFVLAVLFSLNKLYAQEFYYGAYLDKGDATNDLLYSYVGDSLKMNTVIQYADADNDTIKAMLSRFNLIAVKADSAEDAVLHYSHGYYTKWEAEDLTENTLATGMKAKYGSSTTYLNTNCWTSGTNPQYIGDSLLYGPHYRQDKKYRLNHMQGRPLNYDLKFRIAGVYLNPQSTPTGDSVCKVSVVFTYKIGNQFYNKTLDSIMLFDSSLSESFNDFTMSYTYPSEFIQYNSKLSSLNERALLSYDDTYPETGIQFRVTWYGKMQLYIDKFEVYDKEVGYYLANEYEYVVQACSNFANKYNGWTNIKYFYSLGEPQTIDLYTPTRMVDSILAGLNAPRGLAEFYPQWDGQRNGDRTIKKFVEMANPSKVMMEFINYFLEGHTLDWEYEQQRGFLQELHQYRPDFWYEPLIAAPIKRDNTPCWLREPTSAELNASLMLGLAHGTKGIIFWKMVSSDAKEFNCNNDSVTYRCLLNRGGNSFSANSLFYYLKNSFSPRIMGKLGTTLCGLNYTGNFARFKDGVLENSGNNFLSLFDPQIDPDINFHAGILEAKNNNDNKYFLLANLVTDNYRNCGVEVLNTSEYNNLRIFEVEAGSIDTTVTTSFTGVVGLEAGDGKLFQVAPVIKNGGKLIADETISSPETLHEDMTIENGATLYINSTYIANANITVKNGGKIIGGNGGSIVFANNHQLIIEGAAQVNGTLSNRLILNFSSSDSAGVIVKQGGVLSLSFCEVKNAAIGVQSQTGSSVNISNVNFTNCNSNGIVVLGFSNGQQETLPTPVVYKCSITGSFTGISIVNCVEAVIKENTIANCHLGIFINQVSVSHVLKNNVEGYYYPNRSEMAGIFMNSCGGYLRNNTIKNHTYGVHLANSSPDMGTNTIEDNLECGLYVGTGSVPNLVFYMVNPHCWYPIRGCNVIRNNGRYDGVPPASTEGFPVGTEIYLECGDILLNQGGNEISDDRQNIPTSLTLPLINGTRCDSISGRALSALLNYWGVFGPSQARFGTLNVEYDSIGIYCPLPLSPCSLNDIVIHTTDGIAVDTLSSRLTIAAAPPEELEQEYSEADVLFASGDITGAQTIYEQITQDEYTSEEKLRAYNKLYEIGNLDNEQNSYFTSLQNELINISITTTDTLLQKRYYQNSILCDVSNGDYLGAIGKFDDIIQQNPQGAEAVYAEIDILTTALNLDTTNSQLGKISGGKYMVKGSSDYHSKLNEIMKKNFGKAGKEKENLIPTEYSLSQNFPNPFNPTTKIKYQIAPPNFPEGEALVHVTLKIYDILGREIATLVNEEKQAGYYEATFNSINLSSGSGYASGVYFYRILTKDFVKTMKMLMIK